MTAYIARRLLSIIPTLLIVGSLVFFVMRMASGDPAVAILGASATQEALERLRAEMGLDRPLLVQYGEFLLNAVRGDFGRSLITGRSVAEQVFRAFPDTLELVFWGMLIGTVIGLPTGIIAGVRHNSIFDYISRIVALLGLSMPAFYLGILLLLAFAIHLQWFPVISAPRGGFFERMYYTFLPALSLGLIQASFIMRMVRSSLLEVLQEDYIRTAHAKGVHPRRVSYHHALRNALIPVITVMGLYIGTLLAGTVLTETVFNRPGLGRLLVGAIQQRDYPLIQGGLMIYAAVIVVVNTLVDILYGVVDPTIRYD
ncbi:MAG: ABC transporter permease [Limnochordales bacterium]|nr:MAG: ABC transporter permease [Bacillota bacterium]